MSSLIPRMTETGMGTTMSTAVSTTETEVESMTGTGFVTASETTSTSTLVGTAVPTGEEGTKGNATVTVGSPGATATGAAAGLRMQWGIGAIVVAIVGIVV